MGHTCGRTLQKKKPPQGFMPARVYTGLRLCLCWWDSSGGREHRWVCLIRFSLDCIRPEGGMNVLCKQSGDTSVLPITPDMIKLHSLTRPLGAHITLITKVNISMLHPQAERSGGVGLCFNMNTRGGHINISSITLKLSFRCHDHSYVSRYRSTEHYLLPTLCRFINNDRKLFLNEILNISKC